MRSVFNTVKENQKQCVIMQDEIYVQKKLLLYHGGTLFGRATDDPQSLAKTVSQKQPPKGVPRKGVLKICSTFTGEHSCWSATSIKLQSNFIEITLQRGCSLVNLLHIFRTPFLKNTSGRLLLCIRSYDILHVWWTHFYLCYPLQNWICHFFTNKLDLNWCH